MPLQPRRSKLLIASAGRVDRITEAKSVVGIVKDLFPVWLANRQRMIVLDKWARLELDDDMKPVMPEEATPEFMRLRESSTTAFGRLVVTTLCQNTIVDGVRLTNSKENSPAWSVWQRNGLDSKQVPLHESAATYGQAYELVLPAIGRLDRERTAMIRGKSALRALAFYDDPFDEYPQFFLEGEEVQEKPGQLSDTLWELTFTSEAGCYRLRCKYDGSDMTLIPFDSAQDVFRHDMGLCPVVRFPNTIDLDGRVTGEIAPIINNLARIDQSAQDRLVIQRFGAWVVRTIAGMKEPETEAGKAAARIALGVGDLLVSESPDTKFGHIPGSPMQGHIAARDSDIRDLAATSQTPSYHLLGLSDNVGADGMAAAEGAHMRKTDIRKLTWGEEHERALRLAGYAMGNDEIANDFESRVHWRSTRAEAFQSLAQALATLQAAGVPIEMLMPRIPDWTEADTKELKRLQEEARAQEQTDAELEMSRQAELQTKIARAKGAPGGDRNAAAR